MAYAPNFCLRGVNPSQVLNDYMSGYFSTITLPESKITINRDIPIVNSEVATSSNEGIYNIKTKIGQNVTIATIMQKPFQVFTKTGGQIPSGGRCWWCRIDFTHEISGSPIRQEIEQFVVEGQKKTYYIFWIDGIFCDDECCLAYLDHHAHLSQDLRDASYNNAISNLRFLHKLKYPEEPQLEMAQDWKLLDVNGGSLTYEQYKSKKYSYRKTGNIIIIPVKACYAQVQN